MDFLELARQRYSMRKFSDRPVEQEKIDAILEAARLAPTAVNFQPQRILVIREKEALEKLWECTPYHFNAPLAFLVCYDAKAIWRQKNIRVPRDSGAVDASIVGTHMMLAAVSLGVGNTWVMAFDPDAVRAAYHLPESYEPVALFPMGYPAEGTAPHKMHFDRKPVSSFTAYDSF